MAKLQLNLGAGLTPFFCHPNRKGISVADSWLLIADNRSQTNQATIILLYLFINLVLFSFYNLVSL